MCAPGGWSSPVQTLMRPWRSSAGTGARLAGESRLSSCASLAGSASITGLSGSATRAPAGDRAPQAATCLSPGGSWLRPRTFLSTSSSTSCAICESRATRSPSGVCSRRRGRGGRRRRAGSVSMARSCTTMRLDARSYFEFRTAATAAHRPSDLASWNALASQAGRAAVTSPSHIFGRAATARGGRRDQRSSQRGTSDRTTRPEAPCGSPDSAGDRAPDAAVLASSADRGAQPRAHRCLLAVRASDRRGARPRAQGLRP